MPVKRDPSGRRSVEAEVEVPGTPEEVWRAIATGQGISSWFVPTEVEEREGGAIHASFGPNMDSVSKIRAWDPPRRFVADSSDDPSGPTVATEWIVEAQGGGACVVRVVHSWFASSDDWDGQFEGHVHGWQAFFRTLRLVLTHFRDQPSAVIQVMASLPEPTPAAWDTLLKTLGIEAREVGARVVTRDAAPPLSGRIEHVGAAAHPELLLRLDSPAPGLAHLFALTMGGRVFLPIRLYLFGERSSEAARQAQLVWGDWTAHLGS